MEPGKIVFEGRSRQGKDILIELDIQPLMGVTEARSSATSASCAAARLCNAHEGVLTFVVPTFLAARKTRWISSTTTLSCSCAFD